MRHQKRCSNIHNQTEPVVSQPFALIAIASANWQR